MIAEVKTAYSSNARDIVAQLRAAADNIEKAVAGDIRGAVFIVAGPSRSVDVYSWGDLDNFSTLGVLERAKQHIHGVIDA